MPEVQGYKPISLAGVYNAPMSLLDGADASMCGPKLRYGLSFEYGSDLNHDSLLRVASGDGAVAITVAQRCTWLLFLHAIEEPVLVRAHSTSGGHHCERRLLGLDDRTVD